MTYIYACHDCEQSARTKHKKKLLAIDGADGPQSILPPDLYSALVLFETSHRLKPTQEEILEATTCPRCGGHNCSKSFYGYAVLGYTRGYGWLDRDGVKRDMHLHQLTQDDPYSEYRVPGEVDHIKTTLKNEGKKKSKKIYSASRKEMETAVRKSIQK